MASLTVIKTFRPSLEVFFSFDAAKLRTLHATANIFCKKSVKYIDIYDLKTTRIISIQMAPQIRLIQNNDTLMVEKIQSTLVNTIPLWKSQMVLALGISHSQQAIKAQQAVDEMTNSLLKKIWVYVSMLTLRVWNGVRLE